MNQNALAPGHLNPGKGNDLLTNNANYTKTVWNEYDDGQTAGQEGGVLEKNVFKMFSLRTHMASMNERPQSQGDTSSRRGGRGKETAWPVEQTYTCLTI